MGSKLINNPKLKRCDNCYWFKSDPSFPGTGECLKKKYSNGKHKVVNCRYKCDMFNLNFK